jgi:hypothetical protein
MKSIIIPTQTTDARYNINGVKRYRIGTEENGVIHHIEFTLEEMVLLMNQFEFLMTIPDYNYPNVDIRILDGRVVFNNVEQNEEFQIFEYDKEKSEELTKRYMKWLEDRRKR